MTTTRLIARKEYTNGRFGVQSASLSYDDGRWIVHASDVWSHRTLAAAKLDYRSKGKIQ